MMTQVATVTNASDGQVRVKDLVIALMRYADSPETVVYIDVYETVSLQNEREEISIDVNRNQVRGCER
jgi:hypothetical protein